MIINNQGILFLIYMATGAFIGLIFDLFRSLRKSIKTSNIATYIEDILFWIIAGLLIVSIILKFNYGELRLYIFMGIISGSIIYFLTISKTVVKCTSSIICFILKIFNKAKTIILKIFRRPIKFVIINLRKIPPKMKNKKIIKICQRLYKK